MGDISFKELLRHVGHDIVVSTYGKGNSIWNVALECETCSQVLLDYDTTESEIKEARKDETTTKEDRH